MKKFIGILGGILLLLAAAAATLFVLKKKGLIEFEMPCLDEGDGPCDCGCENEETEEEQTPIVDELDSYKPEPKKETAPEPEKKKEPVLKSGFSASDFKL